MSQVIAGLYTIDRKIGSGGGGIVYLGSHLRLGKSVVLKADKRSLSAGEDALRREVDLLKKISHTYIPQVYDYVREDGVVYTVMDYIDGESLDKLIAAERLPTQPEMIRWACQLLEALSYLHNYPPYGILHGDIKPANIMKRTNGDICLIDFNIALALGEEGAVKVGYSRGYASPEHYGADYIAGQRSAAGKYSQWGDDPDGSEETVAADDGSSMTTEQEDSASKSILLDVRSDIYSLGATLYHLISGRKPAHDARMVEPLGPNVCSPAVSAILQKAMAPMPKDRYQTAEEMLAAFRGLPKRDIRVLRHKRRAAVCAAGLTALFLAGGACAFVGLKQMEQRQEALALAEYSANALAEGDVGKAVQRALQAVPSGNSIFEAPVTAQARKALTDALGVYDLQDGFKALDTVELPGAPFCIAVSPDGARFAAVYAYEAAVYETSTRKKIAAFPVRQSALSDAVFVDGSRIVYAGEQGVAAYDLDTGDVLWTGGAATALALSADKSMLAAVDRNADHAVVYQSADGRKAAECFFDGKRPAVPVNDIFADAGGGIFALSGDGQFLAASFEGGGLTVFNVGDPDKSLTVWEESDYLHFEGGFCGKYFAFCADKPEMSVFGLVDTCEMAYLGGFESQDSFFLQADERGIFLANASLLVRFDPDTAEQTELAYTGGAGIRAFAVGEEYVLAAADDGQYSYFDRSAKRASSGSYGEICDFAFFAGKYTILGSRDSPSLRLMELERHGETRILSYDARYVHDESRISSDGRSAMLFGYEGFRIYGTDGGLIAGMELPDAEQIYDQQFRRTDEGSYLEVTWYDGTVRRYSAEDGTVLSECRGKPPDRSLQEEFTTDRYRIVSVLHEAPVVYDLKSGKRVAVLESDDYLIYVTQLGENILTEYVSTEGRRYGLLLDGRLETIACLPGLCDVAGDEAVFDYRAGDLRKCKLYSLEELVELGKEKG